MADKDPIHQNLDNLMATIYSIEASDKLVALIRSLAAFGIKAVPNSLNDPVLQLLLKMNREIKGPEGYVKLGRQHNPMMHHPQRPGDRYSLVWYSDGKISRESQQIYNFDEIITQFCIMWDLNPNHEIFNLIRTDDPGQEIKCS